VPLQLRAFTPLAAAPLVIVVVPNPRRLVRNRIQARNAITGYHPGFQLYEGSTWKSATRPGWSC
jgi:hypothetical protein